MNKIDYRYGNNLDLDQVIELYHASTLGERRPVANRATMKNKLENANLVVTAWDGEVLVGMARTLSDFTLGRLSRRSGRTCVISKARHRHRTDAPNPRAHGAKFHASAARGAKSGRLLPKNRLYATWQRLDVARLRTASQRHLRAHILSRFFR